MKYIIFENAKTKRHAFVVFDEDFSHASIALGAQYRSNYEPISAGFCYRSGFKGSIVVNGESESLRLKSRPEDEAVLNK